MTKCLNGHPVRSYLRKAGSLSVSQPRGEEAGHEAAGVAAGDDVTRTGSSFLQEAQGLGLKQQRGCGEKEENLTEDLSVLEHQMKRASF